MSTPCSTCLVIACQDTDDFTRYSLQTNAFYSPAYNIFGQCPPGYRCLTGLFPMIFSYPAGMFVITMPTLGVSGVTIDDFYMNLQGCQSVFSTLVPAGSTQAQLNTAANAMSLQAAQQQTICDAATDSPAGTVVPI